MPARIAYHELMARLAADDADDREIAQYFAIDLERSDILAPQIRLVENAVFDDLGEVSSADPAGRDVVSAYQRRALRRRRIQPRTRMLADFSGTRVVTYGDSWFHHPCGVNDFIDHLTRRDEYAIYSIDAGADWHSSLQYERPFEAAVRELSASVLVLGGGLRDLLGQRRLRWNLAPLGTNQAAFECLGARFEDALSRIELDYRELFSHLLTEFPDLQVFVHAYDYMIPAHGAWLGQPLAAHGITELATQRELMVEIIDRFNATLVAIASEPGFRHNVHHVDCRGLVKHWHDEVHPTSEGFAAITDRIAQAIDRALDE